MSDNEKQVWESGYDNGWRDAHDTLVGPSGDEQREVLTFDVGAATGPNGDADLDAIARHLWDAGWRKPTDANDQSRMSPPRAASHPAHTSRESLTGGARALAHVLDERLASPGGAFDAAGALARYGYRVVPDGPACSSAELQRVVDDLTVAADRAQERAYADDDPVAADRRDALLAAAKVVASLAADPADRNAEEVA